MLSTAIKYIGDVHYKSDKHQQKYLDMHSRNLMEIIVIYFNLWKVQPFNLDGFWIGFLHLQ